MNFLVNAVIKKEHAALAACSLIDSLFVSTTAFFYIFYRFRMDMGHFCRLLQLVLQMHFLPLRQDC